MSEKTETERRPSHSRHREDRWVDHCEIVTVPRWKTSGLSGDEWRFSYRVVLRRKGYVVKERDFGTLSYAAAWLALAMQTACPAEMPWPDDAPGQPYGDGFLCDNPGCSGVATWRAWLKAEYDNRGQKYVSEWSAPFRVFCQQHSERGDCALEDATDNYDFEPILPEATP